MTAEKDVVEDVEMKEDKVSALLLGEEWLHVKRIKNDCSRTRNQER